MKILERGTVYRADGGMFRYCGWPTVCKDDKGVLYAAFSGHRAAHVCPFGKDLMCVSYDDGKSWSAPMIINDTELDDRDAGILSLGNDTLMMTFFNHPRKFYVDRRHTPKWDKYVFDATTKAMYSALLDVWETIDEENTEGIDKSGSYTRLSRDGGKTWEKAVRSPLTAPHGPILCSDGRLLYLGKRMTDVNDHVFPIMCAESFDMGKSWNILCELPLPDNFTNEALFEPHVAELPDGSLVGAIRAHAKASSSDSAITVLLTYSKDGGKSWTKPEETGIQGTPPHLMLHSSGALILTYGRRIAPFGQRAKISYDGGVTFSDEITLDDLGIDGDLGYPSTVELSDGTLLTVYYQKLPEDKFCSVLYTKWEL